MRSLEQTPRLTNIHDVGLKAVAHTHSSATMAKRPRTGTFPADWCTMFAGLSTVNAMFGCG